VDAKQAIAELFNISVRRIWTSHWGETRLFATEEKIPAKLPVRGELLAILSRVFRNRMRLIVAPAD